MSNYLGSAVYSGSGSNNLGPYPPNSSGVNPLTSDIVPNVDNVYDIGQPAKRIKTGYFTDVNANIAVVDQVLEAKNFFQAEGPSRFFDTVLFLDNTVGINHTDLTNVGSNTHAQIDSALSLAYADIGQLYTDTGANATAITALNTKTQNISAAGADTTITGNLFVPDFAQVTTASFVNLTTVGTADFKVDIKLPDHPAVDDTLTTHDLHVEDDTIHYTQAAIDHVNILNKGTNTHDQIDAKLQNQFAIAPDSTTFKGSIRVSSSTGPYDYLLDSRSNNFNIDRDGLGTILLFDFATFNQSSPYVRGLYVGAGNRPVNTGGFTQTNSVTVSNSNVQTLLTGTGVGSLLMVGGSTVGGSTSMMRLAGVFQTSSNNQVITLRLKRAGGTTVSPDFILLAITINNTWPAGTPWELQLLNTCRTPGASATFATSTKAIFGDQVIASNATTATYDTTVTNVFTTTAQWTTISPNNSITLHQTITNNLYQPMA